MDFEDLRKRRGFIIVPMTLLKLFTEETLKAHGDAQIMPYNSEFHKGQSDAESFFLIKGYSPLFDPIEKDKDLPGYKIIYSARRGHLKSCKQDSSATLEIV